MHATIPKVWELDSKSGLQLGHSSTLEVVPFDRPHIRFPVSLPFQLYVSIATFSICYHFSLNLKKSHDLEHASFRGNLSCMH